MTQFEYEIICETLKAGVPVFANGLINSIASLITENAKLKQEKEDVAKTKNNNTETVEASDNGVQE